MGRQEESFRKRSFARQHQKTFVKGISVYFKYLSKYMPIAGIDPAG
jgi:hypothetical protein